MANREWLDQVISEVKHYGFDAAVVTLLQRILEALVDIEEAIGEQTQ